MGKALRDSGVLARVREHMAKKDRASRTAKIVVLSLNALITEEEIKGIEGKVADALKLRGKIPGKKWPRPAKSMM
jgi:hypothetical protein